MADKIANIATLVRLQGWTVDEHRRELGIMLVREGDLIAEGEAMDRQLRYEQKVAAEDPTYAGHAYAAFAENHRQRRAQWEAVLAALRAEIDAARDRLADAYRELKVLEEVQEEWLIRRSVAEARVEQAEFDEIAQNQYRRNEN